MRKFKKVTAALVAATLAFSTTQAFAVENSAFDYAFPEYISAEYEENHIIPNFLSVSGTVEEISPFYVNDEAKYGEYLIHISTENSSAVLHLNYHTYVLGNEIKVGDKITGYYSTDGFMPLIYPPQHTVRLIVNGDFNNVVIDRFYYNEDLGGLVSADGMLKLNITEDIPVILQDGNEFYVFDESLLADLDGRILVVEYDISTRSIPAITIPNQIIVMWELAVHLPGLIDIDFGFELPQVEDNTVLENGTPLFINNHGITVENEFIDFDWKEIDGAFYVPFRPIMNALGHGEHIVWNGETRTVSVTGKFHFSINSSELVMEGETHNFGHPAIIIDDITWVPFQFFRYALSINAYMHAGQVFIDTSEDMY